MSTKKQAEYSPWSGAEDYREYLGWNNPNVGRLSSETGGARPASNSPNWRATSKYLPLKRAVQGAKRSVSGAIGAQDPIVTKMLTAMERQVNLLIYNVAHYGGNPDRYISAISQGLTHLQAYANQNQGGKAMYDTAMEGISAIDTALAPILGVTGGSLSTPEGQDPNVFPVQRVPTETGAIRGEVSVPVGVGGRVNQQQGAFEIDQVKPSSEKGGNRIPTYQSGQGKYGPNDPGAQYRGADFAAAQRSREQAERGQAAGAEASRQASRGAAAAAAAAKARTQVAGRRSAGGQRMASQQRQDSMLKRAYAFKGLISAIKK